MSGPVQPGPLEFAAMTMECDAERPTGFPVGTYVVARDVQWIDIENLSVGTWVLSRDEKTGEQGYRRVVRKVEHARDSWDAPKKPLHTIEFVTDGGETSAVSATAEHPFWVNGLGWVKARDLRPGHMLEICDPSGADDSSRPDGQKSRDLASGTGRWQARVISVAQDGSVGIVYSIEVEDFHTYFVGTNGVWVHNKDRGTPAFAGVTGFTR